MQHNKLIFLEILNGCWRNNVFCYKNSEKTLLLTKHNKYYIYLYLDKFVYIKVENQKIVWIANLLSNLNNQSSSFPAKNSILYIVNQLNIKVKMLIKFVKETLESNLFDYPDPYILAIGDISITGNGAGASFALKTVYYL